MEMQRQSRHQIWKVCCLILSMIREDDVHRKIQNILKIMFFVQVYYRENIFHINPTCFTINVGPNISLEN